MRRRSRQRACGILDRREDGWGRFGPTAKSSSWRLPGVPEPHSCHGAWLMCRLFGFRSAIDSAVHTSLLAADNALGTQSDRHPDGWGVAYYVQGAPHLTKSPAHALGDQLFHRLSGIVTSQTVLAHVRKATQGELSVLNCHPFQFGRWVFAHNGDIPNFGSVRTALQCLILPKLGRFILGETDSETLFFILMSELERRGALDKPNLDAVLGAAGECVRRVRSICSSAGIEQEVYLTFVITNGEVMVATQGGKELSFSSYKTRCPDRDSCGHLSKACESPVAGGPLRHLLLSSEPLQGDSVWQALSEGELLGVDAGLRLKRGHVRHASLPLV